MNKLLVLQSDFGLVDGAVAAMIGVSAGVDPSLSIHNLTHDITPFHIWEASYRLFQTAEFWPKHTTFVSVVDPGVGSKRRSVIAKTSNGCFFVTPDNGTLTHLKKYVGIVAVREIDEKYHRRENSADSHTFHRRDVYAYAGAKLAGAHISFEEVGPEFDPNDIVELDTGDVEVGENFVKGHIDILDVRFGSLWTNIEKEDFFKVGFKYGDRIECIIKNGKTLVYNNRISFGKSFADVYVSEPIIYVNSLLRLAVAINQGNFAKAYSIGTGISWNIEFRKLD